ncbi:MAG: HipA domain-containing protein [Byssovorax sp.]
MQLKFSMSMVNERLTLAARGRDGIWIVKIAGSEYDELAEVEAATMTWAKLAGFDVPQHFTVPFDHLDGIPPGWTDSFAPAFAIRRFDRRDDGSKIHQEDLCQALDLRPGNKFGERPRVSFEGALRLVHDACGENDGREMARRIGFMIASGNTDAHLKNWGLLWGERTRPALAPCYDLVTTIAWERFGWQRRGGPTLALRLGGETFFRLLNEPALDTCSKNSGYSWAKSEIIEGIERSRDTWSHVLSAAPMRMRKALEEHWEAVPLLAVMGPLPKGRG